MSKEPTGLPEVEDSAALNAEQKEKFDKGKYCPHCEGELRIVSNSNGINGFCGPCKMRFPVSAVPMATEAPPVRGRGLSKQTLVEPDWSRAYDED